MEGRKHWIWLVVGVFAVIAIFLFVRAKPATATRTATTVTPTVDPNLGQVVKDQQAQLKANQDALAAMTTEFTALGHNVQNDEANLATQNGTLTTIQASLAKATDELAAMQSNASVMSVPALMDRLGTDEQNFSALQNWLNSYTNNFGPGRLPASPGTGLPSRISGG